MIEEPQKNIKICLVDDDPNIREMYQAKLQSRGYLVRTAVDGVDGFELIKSYQPDIALIDILMPNMDGIELCKKLQSDAAVADIPILILTNQDDDETLRRMESVQVRFYMVKALSSPDKVVRNVEEVLHNSLKK